MRLRGRATNGTCSCGEARRKPPSKALEVSVSPPESAPAHLDSNASRSALLLAITRVKQSAQNRLELEQNR